MGFKHITIPENGTPIKFAKSRFEVPDNPIIPFIIGDGAGGDIWSAAVRVFDSAVEKAYNSKRKISWMEVYAGEKATALYGQDTWLPEETIEALNNHVVSITGPISNFPGKNSISVSTELKKKLDLYANIRPVKYYPGTPSPVKNPDNVNITIFRENIEGIYTGVEFEPNSDGAEKIKDMLSSLGLIDKIRFPDSSSFALKSVSREGAERIVRASIRYAIDNGLNSVTLVHKGDILQSTEGNFVKWGYEVAKNEFPDKVIAWDDCGGNAPNDMILLNDVLTDDFFQKILLSPQQFKVIASLNQNGDYISGIVCAQAGGKGIIPNGNINFETGKGIFEVTHGPLSKLAGFNKANPSSMILSGAMMLKYIGWTDAADLIEKSFVKTLGNKTVTYDLSRVIDGAIEVKCSEFADLIISNTT